jgi:phosphatidylglycerol:prolipoprotein diacylglycerol transferase
MHPVIFDFGPVAIRFYGLMYVVAIVVGGYLIRSEVRRKGLALTDDDIMNFIIWSVLCGVLGARLYYVAFNLDFYLAFPREIPAIWHGGLAIHGGLFGGFLFAIFYLQRRKVPFWHMGDAVAPSMILGQAFGRFGNFMNGDAHGRPTEMPWGVVFPPESIAGHEFPDTPIHPTMLYEMFINLGIFTLLWFVLRKREYKGGFVFALYVVMYSAGRLFVEHFRADSLMLGPLKAAQVVSAVLIVGVLWVIIKNRLWESSG